MDDQHPAEPEGTEGLAGAEPETGIAQPPPPQPYYPPSIPPMAPPAPQPHYYPPMTPPQGAKHRPTGRLLLIIGLIALLFLAALGGGAVLANASLSSTYGPEKAVTDYLAAQKKGDTSFMIANANYLKGDGSFSQYFDKGGLAAMMSVPQNTDINDVKVSTATVVDSNTRLVKATMTWAGHQLTRDFAVHKDLTRVHYSFYNSWLIDIPFVSIHVTLPNQPGGVSVDGLPLPQSGTNDIQVIQGFHVVTMDATDLYAAATANADGVTVGPSVVFPTKISAAAMAAAVKTIKRAFTTCNAATYTDCLNHVYYAPNKPGFVYFLRSLPGYGDVFFKNYVYSLTTDPTKNMKLVVGAEIGKLAVSGPCAYTLTVNGSKHYYLKGTWRGTLAFAGTTFGYDLFFDCRKAKA